MTPAEMFREIMGEASAHALKVDQEAARCYVLLHPCVPAPASWKAAWMVLTLLKGWCEATERRASMLGFARMVNLKLMPLPLEEGSNLGWLWVAPMRYRWWFFRNYDMRITKPSGYLITPTLAQMLRHNCITLPMDEFRLFGESLVNVFRYSSFADAVIDMAEVLSRLSEDQISKMSFAPIKEKV